MNYYRHHIGDYDSHTAHLSWLEDCAYSRLLRIYYRTERPIPADVAAACRLVRATSKQERSAVEQVLREFFELREDGWHQSRCDAEVSVAREASDDDKTRTENERERQRRHRSERKELFEALRAYNVVPAYSTSTEALRTMLQQRSCHAPVTRDMPLQNHASHAPVTRTATAIHPPTSNHQPSESDPSHSSGSDARAEDDAHLHIQGIRALYPRAPREDWLSAEKYARQLVDDAEASWEQLTDGARRYAELCHATGRLVMNPANFFHASDRPWSQDWPLPQVAIKPKSETPNDRWKAVQAKWKTEDEHRIIDAESPSAVVASAGLLR